MKIALSQFAPALGNIPKNLETHLEHIETAAEEGADLIVFPELSLTGYHLRDLAAEVALNPDRSPVFRKLRNESRRIAVIFGFVEETPRARGLVYNAAACLAGGKLLHIHRKVFLPTGGMFEEARFFAAGRSFSALSAPFGRTGLMICRDFLSAGSGYSLFADGAEIMIAISAAPGRGSSGKGAFTTSRMWELMGEAQAFFSTAFVVYCNRTGVEDGMTFAGGSFIYGPDGNLEARAAYLDDDFLLHDISLDAVASARRSRSFKREDRPDAVARSLERILRTDED
ncbi:MAG: nitrilase-related carbon-nitrogen hydrolase [Acidobacteriota bacterium]|nr:nitrilase-related carbon-nitrogen hydrolase [Acidobacteriota bacterium]